MLHLFKDLLIHGEGGEGGAGAAPAGEAPAAEASAEKTPVAGENKRLTKAERRAKLEEKLAAERNAQQQQTAQQPKQQAKVPWADIKKQYAEEFGNDVRASVQDRFKNQADNAEALASAKAENEKLSGLLAQLAEAQYGIKPGEGGKVDLAAIEAEAQKARVEKYAYENGISEEFAESRIKMEDELAEKDRRLREFEAAEEARKKDEAQYAMFQQHRQQAEAFRQKVPGFDLVQEMERTPLFAHLLSCGVGVESAYWAAHHDELMAAGQQAAATYATRALAANIQAGQSMPTEGGLGRSPAANPQRVFNFKGRSKAEREAFHKSVQRGDKHYF